MIWKNGLTFKAWLKWRENWHVWFAWYPVSVDETEDGHAIKAWLQYVERKGTPVYEGWDNKYRLIK